MLSILSIGYRQTRGWSRNFFITFRRFTIIKIVFPHQKKHDDDGKGNGKISRNMVKNSLLKFIWQDGSVTPFGLKIYKQQAFM